MRAQPLLWLVALVLSGCGEHGHESTWRGQILSMAAEETSAPDISHVAYPPFSEGIFPCSRCHVGGQPDRAPDGPAFPHAKHVDFGLGCADCHMQEGGDDPALPSTDFCFTCHEEGDEAAEGVKAYFDSIRTEDGSYAFPGRWKTRDIVAHHPNHAAAGLDCATCHGEPGDAPILKPRSVPLMEGCVNCHTQSGASVECATCHAEIHDPQHKDIVLHHAERQRGCFGCHNREDRDTLRLANGNTLPFEQSYALCGQCHGPKLRDWRLGLHGKRMGEWNGTKEYMLCVHCHNPHAPRFPSMPALERPLRPEEIR